MDTANLSQSCGNGTSFVPSSLSNMLAIKDQGLFIGSPIKASENTDFYWLNQNETFWNLSTIGCLSNMSTTMNGNLTLNATMGLPAEVTFNSDNIFSVVAYCVLFIVSALGNLTVFITLFRNRRRYRKSRVNLFIMHLCIADLVVTLIMMPMETAWHITVAWMAGDLWCRVFMFFRTFGFYLGSFVLVTISLDRYFAILHPLSINDADKRGRVMLVLAWILSVAASIPQSVIFHVEHHPHLEWFEQCVTFNFFPSPVHELAYNMFNILSIYVFPLLVIIVSYCMILWEISKKSSENTHTTETNTGGKQYLRRSSMNQIQRAKARTLKMTIVIVTVFIVCWSPYYIISIWWWIDNTSASQIDPKIQRGLFIFAVSNSCTHPIVYGMFTIDFHEEFRRCCCLFTHSNAERNATHQQSDIVYTYRGLARRNPIGRQSSSSSSFSSSATRLSLVSSPTRSSHRSHLDYNSNGLVMSRTRAQRYGSGKRCLKHFRAKVYRDEEEREPRGSYFDSRSKVETTARVRYTCSQL